MTLDSCPSGSVDDRRVRYHGQKAGGPVDRGLPDSRRFVFESGAARRFSPVLPVYSRFPTFFPFDAPISASRISE